jgi:FkbM family methyltransferase
MNTKKVRSPRLLWANFYCLLDTSSGASMSIRQILIQLTKAGYEIEIVGATNFDSDLGVTWIKDHQSEIKDKTYVNITENELYHQLAVTKSTYRHEMHHKEITNWYNLYITRLEEFKPDIVFFYGGQPVDYLIPHEARRRNIPSAAYLVNGNYQGVRWLADVDVVVTDTYATSSYYKEYGFSPTPCGKFIDTKKIIPKENKRKNILFINPSLAKGVGVAIQLAMLLEEKRPDIKFEVVKSRGDWDILLKEISTHLGSPRDSLTNVIVTPNTNDMRDVYGRARILLAPSLWWESGARVLAEAMLCGIPAIVTDHGGNSEMIKEGGIKLVLPKECYEKPYNKLPKMDLLLPLIDVICKLYDDEDLYKNYCNRAYKVGMREHNIENSTQKLMSLFEPLVEKRAGDLDHVEYQKLHHKHHLHMSEISAKSNKKEINKSKLFHKLKDGEKGLFIDCGGFDGCSAVKFIIQNPQFDAITFEPNPALWNHYADVPSTLIKKAVYTHGGHVSFTLDVTDADGSTLIDSKEVDYFGKIANNQCPKIDVESVDIAELVREVSKTYQHIVLKIDIEGAEYDVLEKLLKEDLVKYIESIYAEFHWHKCGFPESRHTALVNALHQQTQLVEWDALDYAVYHRSKEHKNKRADLVRKKLGDLYRYQNVSIKMMGLRAGESQ